MHTILPNAYLANSISAYYSLDYLRYGHPRNPDFINTLKNQFNGYDPENLNSALTLLKQYLKRDIRSIFEMIDVEELTIVAIPRAKAEYTYTPSQLFFRRGVQESIEELRIKEKLNLIDGSHFISRHTNTKTTHLSKSNIENDGTMPYIGITKDTCTISNQVLGKDILLIDDIYTPNVNIDEDAIQALYDKGAKSVHFYSVCKTVKYKLV